MGTLLSLSQSATVLWLHASEVVLLASGLLLVVGLIGEMKLPWWHRFFRTFELLVIIGVSGELICDGGIFILTEHLQTASEAEIARITLSAADARLDAQTARLETEQLEVSVAGRRLTRQQEEKIGESLRRFAGRSLFITSYSGDAEAARLGLQIKAALRVARIQTDDNLGRTLAERGGVAFGVQISGPTSERDLISAIAESLREQGGIEAEGHLVEPKMHIGPAVTGIMVALKPLAKAKQAEATSTNNPN